MHTDTKWELYGNGVLGTYMYRTALMLHPYRPGYVNCVKVFGVGSEFQLVVTDGYKTQHAGFYPTSAEAMAAGDRCLLEGAGGWRSNYTED